MRFRLLTFLALFVMLALPLALPAQVKDEKPQNVLLQDFRALDLQEDTTVALEAVVAKYRDRLANAAADVAVLKAQLSKALLPVQPDRAEIKRLVSKSLEIEGEIRLMQIERQIETRALLGDRKWKALNAFLRDLRELLRTNPKWQDKVADKLLNRNLVLLNDLLS